MTLSSPVKRSSRLDQRHQKLLCRKSSVCSVVPGTSVQPGTRLHLMVVAGRSPPRRLAECWRSDGQTQFSQVRSTIVFPRRHFLFTSSDTFPVGCIVQPQHTAKHRTAEISASGIAMGGVVIVTMAIPGAAFSAVRFCSNLKFIASAVQTFDPLCIMLCRIKR